MFLNALIGLALGFLTGLGVGGGSLLMLWLTQACQVPYGQARQLNLISFLPCAGISILLQRRSNKLSFKGLLAPIIAGALSAAVCAFIPVPTKYLRKIFGCLLVITGMRELCYRARNPK